MTDGFMMAKNRSSSPNSHINISSSSPLTSNALTKSYPDIYQNPNNNTNNDNQKNNNSMMEIDC
jgi:hypothetical protein